MAKHADPRIWLEEGGIIEMDDYIEEKILKIKEAPRKKVVIAKTIKSLQSN